MVIDYNIKKISVSTIVIDCDIYKNICKYHGYWWWYI